MKVGFLSKVDRLEAGARAALRRTGERISRALPGRHRSEEDVDPAEAAAQQHRRGECGPRAAGAEGGVVPEGVELAELRRQLAETDVHDGEACRRDSGWTYG